MPVIERFDDAAFEVWHNDVLVAVVYPNRILVNSSEEVDIVFYDTTKEGAWAS